ncbi:hypothetical protein LU293_02370 [Moraxella nasovis]|nr:hypothetical protein [Moraxella nasovis]UNU73774.1 hypothetical protein LU293_02370 [Moraxella nasovis]
MLQTCDDLPCVIGRAIVNEINFTQMTLGQHAARRTAQGGDGIIGITTSI